MTNDLDDLPTAASLRAALRDRITAMEAEVARLRQLVLAVANRLANAADVLAHLAERKRPRRELTGGESAGAKVGGALAGTEAGE